MPDRVRSLAILVRWFTFLSVISCSGPEPGSPEVPPMPETALIRWRRPQANLTLADTIRAEVDFDGPRPGRLVMLSGDSSVAECINPPWHFHWLPAGTQADVFVLRVVADPGSDSEIGGPPIRIHWYPNEAPSVHLLTVERATAVPRSELPLLRVEAIDAEEGLLEGESIVWASDIQGLAGYGAELPTASLIPGLHRLKVRASDYWLRATSIGLEIELFDYRGPASPEGLLFDLEHALRARDPDVYAGCLTPAFRFRFCPAERETEPTLPPFLDQSSELAFIRTILGNGRWNLQTAAWRIASLQTSTIGEETVAKAELDRVDLRLDWDGQQAGRVEGGKARLYLKKSTDGGSWGLEQWQDLGSRSGLSQGGLRRRVLESGTGAS